MEPHSHIEHIGSKDSNYLLTSFYIFYVNHVTIWKILFPFGFWLVQVRN
jgi:hypothetical protein